MHFFSLATMILLSLNSPLTESGRVIAVIDASVDEYVACLLVTTMEDYTLDGIIIVNADCLAGPAMNALWKMLTFIDMENTIPVGLSLVRGVNSFPWSYRGDCSKVGQIDVLRDLSLNNSWPLYPPHEGASSHIILNTGTFPDGDSLLATLLENALSNDEQVTLLVHCPLTPITVCLQKDPRLNEAIGHLVWMGGAFRGCPGNLDPNTVPASVANPNAEWNAFWDPVSVDWLLSNTEFPITIFPLNTTDQAKFSEAFKDSLESQAENYPYSKLALQAYSVVVDEPFFELWNTLTSCYLSRAELFEDPVAMELGIVTQGYWQGSFIEIENAPRTVDVVLAIADSTSFYEYVLTQFRQ